jgi:hypothetical protein
VFVAKMLAHATVKGMSIILPPFLRDSRGNRLENYKVVPVRGREHVRLYLCGPEEVAQQVLWMLQTPGARQINLEDGQEREWSHRIHVEGPLPQREALAAIRRGFGRDYLAFAESKERLVVSESPLATRTAFSLTGGASPGTTPPATS